jgi:hypothetical protein
MKSPARVPLETGNDPKSLLHACRRHLCPDRASAADPDCDGVVRHLEWRRCAVLGELDCRHRGGRVELRRLPRRHAPLKAGELARADPSPGSGATPTRGHLSDWCRSSRYVLINSRPLYPRNYGSECSRKKRRISLVASGPRGSV